MKPFQFFLVCIAYILFALISSLQHGEAEAQPNVPPGDNCSEERFKIYTEDFYMQMGLCQKNLTVLCAIKPTHPCLSDQSKFKVTAYVKGNLGRCLIEGNVSITETLRYYVEAKRIKNPNQAGSRSLGGDRERHQRGKCVLKYICNKRKIRSVAIDCGSVFETKNGNLENFTRKKTLWTAPKNYEGSVYFFSQVKVSAAVREFDVSTVKMILPAQNDTDKKKSRKKQDSEDDDDDDHENDDDKNDNDSKN